MKVVDDSLRTEHPASGKYKALYETILTGSTVWESDTEVNYNSVVVGFRHADNSAWKLRTHRYEMDGEKGHLYWVEKR